MFDIVSNKAANLIGQKRNKDQKEEETKMISISQAAEKLSNSISEAQEILEHFYEEE